MRPFLVRLSGSFYSFDMYDADGRELTDMSSAADYAESEFGTDWTEVYNGSEGIDRDEYIRRGCLC